MKIAILGIKGVPGHHGVEVVVDSLLPYLTEMGHEITVYGYSSYTHDMDDYQGACVKTVSGATSGALEMVSHMWKASSDTRNGEYDIVHIHSADPCVLAWRPRAKHGVIATSHGQAYLRKKWGVLPRTMSKVAEKFFIRLPRIATSVSKPLADYYRNKYGKNVLYIPNGIKFRKSPAEAFLSKFNLQPRKFLFCSAGRIERTKGLDTLLEAYRMLGAGALPLVIAGGGSGSDFDYFEELKKSKPGGVNFTGFLTGDEFFALYAHARIFVFPSEYEAMSMALLEGMSFGTPTVFSNIPENEAVADDLGYPFKVSDAKSLADTINHVLLNYDYALNDGEKVKEAVRKKHDWATIAKQYHQLYAKSVQSPGVA